MKYSMISNKELTEADQKILKAAGDFSAYERASVEDVAKRAGVSPDTIYKKMQNDEFRELFLEAFTNTIAAEVPTILQTFVEKSKEGSFKHGKLLLEITGVYTEKKEIKGKFGVSADEEPFESSEQRKEFLAETLNRVNAEKVEE